jgi:hypothetical protein
MLNQIRSLYKHRPLLLVLLVAVLLRLCAVIFSQGYAMHDDHFLVVEAPQSWLDGYDYDNWKPENNDGVPTGHNLFYPGLQYSVLSLCSALGIDAPQSKMMVVRLLHALLSLLMVFAAYKITEKIASAKEAFVVGIIMAALWVMPFLSVRNLIEFVCIAPIIWASWLVVKRGLDSIPVALMTGFLCGIGMGIRFQLVFFIGGWGLALLFSKKWRSAILYGLAAVTAFFLTQMGDLFWWDKPFTEIMAYVDYNIIHATTYFDRPWYQYILTILGVLVPPVGLFLLFGFFKTWKKHLILFLPAFCFLAFHSYFPNKQERFIIPILPYIIILGTVGFLQFKEGSKFWAKRKGLWKGLVAFALVINTLALGLLTFSYTKKSRVETMTFLYHQEDFRNYILDYSHKGDYVLPPQFYSGKWGVYYYLTSKYDHEFFLYTVYPQIEGTEHVPNYVLFYEADRLEERKADFVSHFGEMEYVTTIMPGNFDRLLHWLNPRNRNEQVEIYKILRYQN